MIPLPPSMWGALGAVVVIAGLGIGLKVQTARLDACQAKHAAYVAEVDAIGQAAAKDAKTRESANLKAKERADNESARAKRDLAGVYDAYQLLLHAEAGRSPLPAAAPGAADPDLACFSRAALDRGLAVVDATLQAGALNILRRGDQAIADLNTAKAWAKERW